MNGVWVSNKTVKIKVPCHKVTLFYQLNPNCNAVLISALKDKIEATENHHHIVNEFLKFINESEKGEYENELCHYKVKKDHGI